MMARISASSFGIPIRAAVLPRMSSSGPGKLKLVGLPGSEGIAPGLMESEACSETDARSESEGMVHPSGGKDDVGPPPVLPQCSGRDIGKATRPSLGGAAQRTIPAVPMGAWPCGGISASRWGGIAARSINAGGRRRQRRPPLAIEDGEAAMTVELMDAPAPRTRKPRAAKPAAPISAQ